MLFLFGVAAIALFLVSLDRVLGVKKSDSEPPFIPMSVPYFGHLFGVLIEQTSYYARVRYVVHYLAQVITRALGPDSSAASNMATSCKVLPCLADAFTL